MKRNMRHTEKAITHPISIGGLNAVVSASTGLGWNGAAVMARIDYIRRAVNCGLVQENCLGRAQSTIRNLEGML